jgi:hypothetical protein
MNFVFKIPLFFLPVFFLISCTDSEKQDALPQKYSIYAMTRDGKEYLVNTNRLDSGDIDPVRQGVSVNPPRLYHDLIVRDGYYYRLDGRTGKFIQYSVADGSFSPGRFLQIDHFTTIENYNWVSSDTLLLIGYDTKGKKAHFAKVNVTNMAASQGELPIPAPFGNYNWMSIGFSKLVDDKLIIGYCYHSTAKLHSYTTSDTLYAEIISYPDMKPIDRLKDTRSTYPGGINSAQESFFTDEEGDFYFLTCPGIATGNVPEKPTGILRIKRSEDRIDQNYFFNISTSPIQNHGYGLWYIGNGKAIVRTERKGVFSGVSDHWKVPHFDFYVLDLANQTTTRLNLPLDKGTRKQCVLVEKGLAYIAVNSDADGSYVWIYDPKRKDLKKGLHLAGNIDYFLRLERLN